MFGLQFMKSPLLTRPELWVTVKEVFHSRNVFKIAEKASVDISFLPVINWESLEEKDETEEIFGKFERKNFFVDNLCLYKDDTKKYFVCEVFGRNSYKNLGQMRGFHSSARVLDEFGEQRNDTGYLQPSKSTLSVVKLAKRAGFDIQSLPQKEQESRFKPKKNILRRLLAKEQPKEEKVEKIEEAPPLDEKPPAVSLIRQLSKKQEEMRKQKLLKLREEEDVFLNHRRKLHTSAMNRKDKKEEKEEYLPPICSGCQGIAKALEDFDKPRGKISCATRGAGKCRGIKRKDGGSSEAKTLHNRCKFIPYGRCRQPREEVCEVEREYGISCMDAKNKNKKKFHTCAVAQSALIMADDSDDYCPWVPAKRGKKQEVKSDDKPKLEECPRDPTRKRKDCAKIERMKTCVPQKTTAKTYICKLAGILGIGCGRKIRAKKQKN